MPELNKSYRALFISLELLFTIAFTIEYILRIICIKNPKSYIFSFFGLVDLISILPTYLGLLLMGQPHYLAVIRVLRVLRIFRVLKLAHYLSEANILQIALLRSRRKIFIFFSSVLVLVTILGSIMYIIENGHNPVFKSIPHSIYWAIVTITTVGYGDMAPITGFGRFISSFIMLLGYAIIAVPSGIVTSELTQGLRNRKKFNNTQSCKSCCHDDHDNDAKHCKMCGEEL